MLLCIPTTNQSLCHWGHFKCKHIIRFYIIQHILKKSRNHKGAIVSYHTDRTSTSRDQRNPDDFNTIPSFSSFLCIPISLEEFTHRIVRDSREHRNFVTALYPLSCNIVDSKSLRIKILRDYKDMLWITFSASFVISVLRVILLWV